VPVEDVFNPCARRALLLGGGALGVAVLAGCGGEDPAPSAGGGASSAAPAATTPAGNPFDNTGAATAPGEQAPPAGALVAVKEVPVGGGVVVNNNVLVVQPKQGTIKAFDAGCPHQGYIVDPPVGGNPIIMCPGHNSQFKTADGSLVRGPATRGLNAVAVKVQNGYVVEA
jgi:nitrite reductase/ring-hydroxylating ferredoxin subunit